MKDERTLQIILIGVLIVGLTWAFWTRRCSLHCSAFQDGYVGNGAARHMPNYDMVPYAYDGGQRPGRTGERMGLSKVANDDGRPLFPPVGIPPSWNPPE